MILLRFAAVVLLLSLPTAGSAMPRGWPGALPSQPSERLEAWFLGNTTVLFRAGDQAILIDGFLSRSTNLKFLFRLETDRGLVARCLAAAGIAVDGDRDGARLSAVLVAHGHYDHALDAAYVARITGATLAGAPSTLRVIPRAGRPDVHEFKPREPKRFGRFMVREFRFPHSWPNLFPGSVSAAVKQSAGAGAYRDNGSSGFHITIDGFRILVHPSAGFRPPGYGDLEADVVFLSMGGLGLRGASFAHRYWDAVVGGRDARLVIPIHWDQINRPLRRGFALDSLASGPRPAMRHIRQAAAREPAQSEAGESDANAPALRLMPFFAPVDLRYAAEALPAGEPLSLAAPRCADPERRGGGGGPPTPRPTSS